MSGPFDAFLRYAAESCVNGSSGSMYAKPSLEAPEPGTVCPECGEPVNIIGPIFCAGCEEGER